MSNSFQSALAEVHQGTLAIATRKPGDLSEEKLNATTKKKFNAKRKQLRASR